LVFCLLAPIGFIYWPFRFGMLYICEACAITRCRDERQLPMIDVTWWTTHTPEEHTPLSRYLVDEAIVGAHVHSWSGVHGGGNAIQCATGRGTWIHRTAREPDVLAFLRFLKAQKDREATARWVSFLLCSQTACSARSLLWRLQNYPTMEQAWWNERVRMEEERVALIEEAKRYP
jgi:hypothetical protein